MQEQKIGPPMEQRRLVTYVNHFITSTVTFLNNFMIHCEAKLMKSEQRLQKISASLCILETKLNSVPELQGLDIQQVPLGEKSPIILPEKTSQNTNPDVEPNQVRHDIVSKSEPVESVVDESPKETTIEVDPTILKYRKMLQFGVPRGAVELKMVHEGLDPTLL